jgi:hypothetical protein
LIGPARPAAAIRFCDHLLHLLLGTRQHRLDLRGTLQLAGAEQGLRSDRLLDMQLLIQVRPDHKHRLAQSRGPSYELLCSPL